MKKILLTILRLFSLTTILLLLNSCVFESMKRMSDRQDAIREILGPSNENGVVNWSYEIQKDTIISDIRLDSIAVKLAMEIGLKQQAFKQVDDKLCKLFPEGNTDITVGELNEKQLAIYKQLPPILLEIARLRKQLKDRIANFKPSINPVVIVNPQGYKSRHYFFFNKENELVTHFYDDNTFLTEGVFKEFVDEDKNEKFYLPTLYEAVENIDTVSSIAYLYSKSTPLKLFHYEIHVDNSTSYTRNEQSSPFPAGANLYVVKKRAYATSTKDGYDRLVEYSNANDLSSIDYMVVNGEISILNPGDEVMMLDCGFMVSKVKNKNGYVVFVDTGSIRKKD